MPLLAFPDGGDFHQLAGSPTIDAGAGDALLGAQDIDQTPRTAGAAPDIGADEYVAPAPPAVPPDTNAPSITIDQAPKTPVKTTKFSIAFAAAETATFTCALDSRPPVPCTSPFGKVKRGRHTVVITATDAAGNVSPSSTVTWKVKRKKRGGRPARSIRKG